LAVSLTVTVMLDEHMGIDEVFNDPDGVAKTLSDRVYGLAEIEVRLTDGKCVIIWLTLEPWRELVAEHYPTERVSICVWRDGTIMAVPHHADGRRWLHRQPTVMGELCLWYPEDPRALQWRWEDGLVNYVTIVHRHLLGEEFWRRKAYWPSEDAPHGAGPHPIRTAEMRRAAQMWRFR
jgi:hypothetical protein